MKQMATLLLSLLLGLSIRKLIRMAGFHFRMVSLAHLLLCSGAGQAQYIKGVQQIHPFRNSPFRRRRGSIYRKDVRE